MGDTTLEFSAGENIDARLAKHSRSRTAGNMQQTSSLANGIINPKFPGSSCSLPRVILDSLSLRVRAKISILEYHASRKDEAAALQGAGCGVPQGTLDEINKRLDFLIPELERKAPFHALRQ